VLIEALGCATELHLHKPSWTHTQIRLQIDGVAVFLSAIYLWDILCALDVSKATAERSSGLERCAPGSVYFRWGWSGCKRGTNLSGACESFVS